MPEIKGSLILPRVAAAPSSPTAGQIYFNTADNTMYYYNGTAWVPMTAAGAAVGDPPGVVVAYAGAAAPSGWLFCDGSLVSRTTYAALFTAIGTLYGAGDGSTTFGLPDYRGDVLVGKAASGTFATLGASGGEETHVLLTRELAAHSHATTASFTGNAMAGHVHASTATFAGNALPNHQHNLTERTEAAGDAKTDSFQAGTAGTQNLIRRLNNQGGTTGTWIYLLTGLASAGTPSGTVTMSNPSVSAGTPSGTIFTSNPNSGLDYAHNNLQPYQVVNYMIKT